MFLEEQFAELLALIKLRFPVRMDTGAKNEINEVPRRIPIEFPGADNCDSVEDEFVEKEPMKNWDEIISTSTIAGLQSSSSSQIVAERGDEFPHGRAYNILVVGASESEDKAYKVCVEMSRPNLAGDLKAYNILVVGACESEDRAYYVFDEMPSQTLIDSEKVIEVAGAKQMGEMQGDESLEDADELLDEMPMSAPTILQSASQNTVKIAAHKVFDELTEPVPTGLLRTEDSFYVSLLGNEVNPPLYGFGTCLANESDQSYISKLGIVPLWGGEVLMFVFDPGGTSWQRMDSELISKVIYRVQELFHDHELWSSTVITKLAIRIDDYSRELLYWSDVINRTNENVKYLPGIKLGKNVVADPDLEHAVKDANMLVFVTPHQFMEGICRRLVGNIRTDAEAISLIKGMEVKKEGPCMISTLISEQLGINCCVLMGANIANEIAVEKFSEATVGYRENRGIAEKWVHLFNTPYFAVTAVQDVEGVELCGTLKNVVALAAGFVDGLEMGNNTKAAIMRIGLREMKALSKLLFSSVKDSTFFESCGVADLITTCLGGRNRKCAEAFAKHNGKRSFDELEAEMLQGQKLQGVSTAKEVYEVLRYRGWLELFPLFATVHEICSGRLPPAAIVERRSEHMQKFLEASL